jgi:hypothetical protein
VGLEVLLWGVALLFVSLDVVQLEIGLPICALLAIIVMVGELVYIRVVLGTQENKV